MTGPHVVTAVLMDGDRVLLCHRSPDRRLDPDVWDLPGGHVEPAESPSAALVRELHEELGITISEPSHPPFTTISTDDYEMSVWLIQQWDGTVTNCAPDEHDDLIWLDAAGLTALAPAELAHPHYPRLLTETLTRASGSPQTPEVPK